MNTLPINPSSPNSADALVGPAATAPAQPALLPAATPHLIPTQPGSISSELAAGGFGGAIGTVDVLSPEEEVRFAECETAIQNSWRSFFGIGVALAEIRDSRLYRNEYNTFDDYCQSRWDFKRGKAHYLIAAAQIFRTISATSGPPYPDHESQLRPLLALDPYNAQIAWDYAVKMSLGRPVTARIMKRAVADLNLIPPTAPRTQPQGHQSKRQIRCLVTDTMNELLGLVTRHAEYPDLLEKLEVLNRQLRLLFQPEKRRNP